MRHLLLLMGVALVMASCSDSGGPEDEPAVHLEYIVTSRLEYGKDSADVSSLANAYFYGDDGFESPDSVQVNRMRLPELSEGNFSLSMPPVPDSPYAVRWTFGRFLGSDFDHEFRMPSVLHFLNVRNGDTISARSGTVIAHTGISSTALGVWIESTFPHIDTSTVRLLQDNDGLLELTPSALAKLQPNKRYRLTISSENFVVEPYRTASLTCSLYSEAIMEFVLVE